MTTRQTVIISGTNVKVRAKPGEAAQYLRDVVIPYVGEDCLLWPFARNSAGYGHIWLAGKDQLVHRIACEALHGFSPTPWHDAAHSCGNGHLGCCSPKHLRWATPLENQQEMVRHGRSQQGERHYAAKLTASDVLAIRSSAASSQELADQFGVNRTNIIAIRKRKSWRHI
ncbi:hypothetical protein ACLE20_13215 [Rhizobium sp. YIM 134829]|uniref:hypothetical protein n=1 Tax=Rhizobium sp. YIM 134829 TaxID=3390453 RepID=UPI00397BA965